MKDSAIKHPEPLPAGGVQPLLILAGLVLMMVLAVWMLISQDIISAPSKAPDMTNVSQAAFTEATGVRLLHVAIIAEGGMIDVRYQVVDPDKAVVVHDADEPFTIIDEATGNSLSRSWHQHSHSQDFHAGITYYELIMNADGLLKTGSMVTVKLGDAQVEHVPVQ